MPARKKNDHSPRKSKVRQVCLTPVHDQMLTEVANKRYNGRVSHALLGLLSKPLKKAYLDLCVADVIEENAAN
tara:strand:+ start:810 stop:1028 length:219 start_codon:yes stop_codon:yes gene_type:complete